MSILFDLINCKDKPKQTLTLLATSLCDSLSQREVVTLTAVLLRLYYQNTDKKPDNIFLDHPFIASLSCRVLTDFYFSASHQSKNEFTQQILQAYHLEQNIVDKKQEVLRNQMLVAQFELDLRYQEIEIACLDIPVNLHKETLSHFKTKYKIAKKALKHSQLDILQVLSQLNTLKQKIKEDLRNANEHFMILFAPLFDACGKSHDSTPEIFSKFLVQFLVYHAQTNKTCPNAALPLITQYLKKLMVFPERIDIPFVASLNEAMLQKDLVHLSQETLNKIQIIFEATLHEKEALSENISQGVSQSKKNMNALIKDFLWSNLLTKRNALYN